MERQIITFKLGNSEYAVDILSVQEINRISDITKVPKSPEFIEGVINLRGKVIPVVNLRKRFGLDYKELDSSSRIVVLLINGIMIGAIVDSVSEVMRIPSDAIEPPPPAAKMSSEFISGIGKLKDRLIMLLDIDRLLSKDNLALLTN